ncbi:hypothetical protein D3Z39_07665 [Anaerotruncus colihominis]|jgi:hypothetical protein|uniref:Uncharacterized protein n=1 Tax=Anaerotruncus colihominis TaxID=169435 RepID=A0A845RF58_9FIRM|nr:hypothetical protein [Anaerotruncus colihominis]
MGFPPAVFGRYPYYKQSNLIFQWTHAARCNFFSRPAAAGGQIFTTVGYGAANSRIMIDDVPVSIQKPRRRHCKAVRGEVLFTRKGAVK